MDAHICFKPGICSDDGRALTGWYDLYLRSSKLRGTNAYWDEPIFFHNMKEAEDYCKDKGYEIVSRLGM